MGVEKRLIGGGPSSSLAVSVGGVQMDSETMGPAFSSSNQLTSWN